MKTGWMAVLVVITGLMTAAAPVRADEGDFVPLRSTNMMLGGPTSRRVGGFRVGDIVWFRDPSGVDGWLQGAIVRSSTTIDSDLRTGNSRSRQVGFDVLVPSSVPGGESTVYSVGVDGRSLTHSSATEYVQFLQSQLATSLRNAMTSGAFARRQAAAASARLSALDASTRRTTDRYTTGSGAARLAGEVAIAIAVDRASRGLPHQYQHMNHAETEMVNSLARAGIQATGGALRDVLRNPTEEGGRDAARNFGLTAGAQTTFGPLIQQMVNDGRMTQGQAEHALAGLQGLVNVGVASATARDGERLQAAGRQALDELYEAGLPPGVGILARDATNMGFALIDYSIVTSDLRMASLNLDVVADHQNRASASRFALSQFANLDQLMQVRAGVFVAPAAPAPVAPQTSTPGSNVGRSAETRPLAAGTAAGTTPSGRTMPGAGVAH